MRGDFSLDERYKKESGSVFLSGIQALVRLTMEQKLGDGRSGLNTGGFISGYRGSPLGGFDKELWQQRTRLEALDIRFQPGVNEELAATAVWGTQQVGLFPGSRVDGSSRATRSTWPGTRRGRGTGRVRLTGRSR